MSAEAVAWASDQLPPKGRSKELLRLLAGFADAHGEAWAAVGTLGEEMQLSDRQVQRLLRVLEANGFIAPTGRFRYRNVPYFKLALDRPGELAEIRAARRVARRTPAAPAKGDISVTLSPANGDMDVTVQAANGDIRDARTVTPMSPNIKRDINLEADASRAGARVIDPQFEAMFVAWAGASPGRASRPRAWRVWIAAAARIDPAAIAAAAMRYLAEDEPARRLGPLDLHRWLAEERWEPWLTDPVTPARRVWPGPAAIRAAVAAARGEDFAGSWLDHGGWDAARGAILTRTALAARALRDGLHADVWTALGVKIIEKGSEP